MMLLFCYYHCPYFPAFPNHFTLLLSALLLLLLLSLLLVVVFVVIVVGQCCCLHCCGCCCCCCSCSGCCFWSMLLLSSLSKSHHVFVVVIILSYCLGLLGVLVFLFSGTPFLSSLSLLLLVSGISSGHCNTMWPSWKYLVVNLCSKMRSPYNRGYSINVY